MTYGFFAPDSRYAYDRSPGGPTREFKNMVRDFHDEGIEVYLDVVFNHTGEGGVWDGVAETAEVLFLRGLDNSEYYALSEGNAYYWDSTGCGNNLDASSAVVRQLIKDSLEYWADDMGVDGFRFDLATVLGRTGRDHRFEGGGILLREIAAADLSTTDVARASEFYTQLFGWKLEKGENDPSGYVHIKNGDEYIGGIPPAEHRDPNTPPHWLLYFETSNCDASVEKAKQNGARVYYGPVSMENVGRLAILVDPQGAVFSVFQSARKANAA
jgi:predicted enzyme related to lactoylglutathione lyase